MQKIHRQGSIAGGIFLITLALVIIITLTIMMIANRELFEYAKDHDEFKGDVSRIVIQSIFLVFGALFSGVWGTIILVNGIRGNKVKRVGKLSTCTVYSVREVYYRRRLSSEYVLEVIYTGESGNRHELKVSFAKSRVDFEIEKGMVFNCTVYNEDCYLDITRLEPLNNVEVINDFSNEDSD